MAQNVRISEADRDPAVPGGENGAPKDDSSVP
jgi:hypothetical protein